MANWATLKADIAAVIKANGNKEITGMILQSALNSIISNIGENATFKGIATPTTVPGTPDGNVFYLCNEAGTYTNFNGIILDGNTTKILKNTKNGWIYENTEIVTRTGLDTFTEDMATKQLVSDKTLIQGGTVNFINNPLWKFGANELTQNAKDDYAIIESDSNNYFNYLGRCIKLSSVEVKGLKDWRITANIITARSGQKIKVVAEIFVRNLNGGCTISTISSDFIAGGDLALKNGMNIYTCTFNYDGSSKIDIFMPMNLASNIGVELYIGRIFIGHDGNGNVFGDNNKDYITAIKKYGRDELADNPFGSTSGIATNINPATEAGVLSHIHYRSENGGMAKFGVGIVDQRSIAVIRKIFEVNTVVGLNELDVLSNKIDINMGEQLFVYMQATGNPLFGISMYESDVTILYNSTNPASPIYGIGSTYGGYIELSWTVSKIDELYYAPNYKFSKLEEKETELSKQVNSFISTADLKTDIFTGNKYKLRVQNGVLNVIPQRFKNVVCLGNSLAQYPSSPPLWWGGGMAAYQQSEDWVHVLQAGLRVKEPTATCTPIPNIRWEFDQAATVLSAMDAYLLPNTDLLVFQLGENISSTVVSSIQDAFKTLVLYCATKCPNAEIIITGTFWVSEIIDTALQNVAIELGLTFVKKSQLDTAENKSFVGAIVKGIDGLEHVVNENGVAAHPNSLGHKKIANLILKSIGYSEVI